MSRLYDTEAALNLILSDDSEAESDGEPAEPMCPGSDEEFDIDIGEQLFSFQQRYKWNRCTNMRIYYFMQLSIVMNLIVKWKLTATVSHQVQLLTPKI